MRVFVYAFILSLLPAAAAAQNYKITQSTDMSGQKMGSTVYVKGTRKRTENASMMGMGDSIATIEQCDLKRTVQVNDKKKLYYVQSTSAEVSEPTSAPAGKPAAAVGKATKGGTVTHTSSIIDTGERKQMFGLTARRIKTSMTMESSPDACSKQDMRIDSDGWYVDLPLFSCPAPAASVPMRVGAPQSRGCEDRIITKSTGTGKLGFALELTQTIITAGQDVAYSTVLETLEFSKATLDGALFDVPSDYKLANSTQDLYGMPDMTAIMKGAGNQDTEDVPTSGRLDSSPSTPSKSATPFSKRPGVKRIGVLMPINHTKENVNTAHLLAYLVQQLTIGTVEAIPIGTEADAKREDCDYILTSNISKLKESTASKIGGLFGKVTSTDSSASRSFEAQVDFKLMTLADGKAVLQNKASAKVAGDAEVAAQGVLSQEATAVLAAAK